MSNDVLIFCEQRGGKVHPAALQLVTAARTLAGQTGGQIVAVLIGDQLDAAAGEIGPAGVDRLITIADAALGKYSALRYRTALAAAIEKVQPRIVLLAATFMGRDLGPRVAARLQAAAATDVTELKYADGALDVRRPVYNGKAFCHVRFPQNRVAVVSVRPNAFAAPAGGAAPAAREALAFAAAPGDERIAVQDVVRTGGGDKDVAEADIIVSGGRALKSADNFKLLFDLAHELDAAVGASRAACDAGYQPHSRQVGLTGKTVTPRLYIAAGISGAIQHLAGMRGSKVIVAVNTDKEAPLIKIADYAIVGDLFKVVPAITAAVQRMKG